MKSTFLLHHLLFNSAQRAPEPIALSAESQTWTYAKLASECVHFSQELLELGVRKQDRIAIFLEKRIEFVIAVFGSSCAGTIFVPINPILKADQIHHILKDSGAKVFVTSLDRYQNLPLNFFDDLLVQEIFLTDFTAKETQLKSDDDRLRFKKNCRSWSESLKKPIANLPDTEHSLVSSIDCDAVSIFYTSGSTGRPKGVVLSHRNMVFGAKNVASYLENTNNDVLLAALPLSFDAGFSQLTTAFHVGARVVLLNYLMPQDILKTVVQEKVTGLTAVPPLWMQVMNLSWPQSVASHLRYIANTGGRMPLEVLKKLRMNFPDAKPYLMYGLTESFRSTYLPPEEIDRIPSSMGRAIPNAEILILRADGSCCDVDEPGELVHRGALVGLGYWNDPEKTAERYKVLPKAASQRPLEIIQPEFVVFSGDLVRRDADGYIYFIGRNDEMIKTSGYRVSPTEVEEAFFATGIVAEAAAFGIPHEFLGQSIIVSVLSIEPSLEKEEALRLQMQLQLLKQVKERLPAYMMPSEIVFTPVPHPRNQNGKIDRKKIAGDFLQGKQAMTEGARKS